MDIIVVLGLSLSNGEMKKELKARLDLALQINDVYSNKSGTFIVTGDGAGTTEAKVMYDYLILNHIPSKQIIMEDKAKNTFENIIFTTKIVKNLKDVNSITYVSGTYHLERVERILKYFGPMGIQMYSSGSGDFPESRVEAEKRIMPKFDKILQIYLTSNK